MFFAPVAVNVKKKSEKTKSVESIRHDRDRRFVEATYGTDAQSASSNQ